MAGTEQLNKVADLGGEIINVVFKPNKNILSVLSFADELMGLNGVTLEGLLQEAKDLDSAEREKLNARLKAKIVLENKELEAKIESVGDIVNLSIETAFDAYVIVMDFKVRVEVIVDKVKNIFPSN